MTFFLCVLPNAVMLLHCKTAWCQFIFIAGKRPELSTYLTQIQIKLDYDYRNNFNHANDLLILHTSHKHRTLQTHANPFSCRKCWLSAKHSPALLPRIKHTAPHKLKGNVPTVKRRRTWAINFTLWSLQPRYPLVEHGLVSNQSVT
jgi:hypothetical protein